MATETPAAINVGVAVVVGIEIDTEAAEIGAEIETDDIEGFKKVYVVRKFHYVCQLKMRFLGDFSYLSAV